jgi:lipopolysaccharide export system ATP-binding protein
MAILEVRGLVKIYGRRKVVDGVNFEVDLGEVVGLLGPNGAGKTTSFRMTTGQIVPNEGQVNFTGKDVSQYPMYRRARLGMGYLSQEMSIFRKLTVEQNILAVLEALPQSRSLGRKLTRRERHERTEAVLEQFGLTRIRKTVSARCSGGEKRRIEIARCLVCEPQLILLDEPFAGVDPLTKADIRSIVRDLATQGIGILMTDHDVTEVLKTTDRIYLIKDGKVRTHGTPHQIVRDQVAIDEYLGDGYGNVQIPERGGESSVPAAQPVAATQPGRVMERVLEQEKFHRLIEGLKGPTPDQVQSAARELVGHGTSAVPALLEALERRDLDLRQRAAQVLQYLLGGTLAFDPYAPEAQRRQQLAALREGLETRRAG